MIPQDRKDGTYRILYEDSDLFVIWKPAGLAVQSARPSQPDVMSMLRSELVQRGEKAPYLGLVNRLDQPVEGIFLVAGNAHAAAALSRQAAGHDSMKKWYLALVCGKLVPAEGNLVDYLRKDNAANRSFVAPAGTAGAKRSELTYRVLLEQEGKSLVEIRLRTGRHHQIRVQLAHAGAPILGDFKYGGAAAGEGQLALCAYRIEFRHPRTGKLMCFREEPTFPVPPTAL